MLGITNKIQINYSMLLIILQMNKYVCTIHSYFLIFCKLKNIDLYHNIKFLTKLIEFHSFKNVLVVVVLTSSIFTLILSSQWLLKIRVKVIKNYAILYMFQSKVKILSIKIINKYW